jgi:hypothetical protein
MRSNGREVVQGAVAARRRREGYGDDWESLWRYMRNYRWMKGDLSGQGDERVERTADGSRKR